MTREGVYRLMTLPDYSRPSRVGYANQQGAGSTPVKVSFVGNCANGPGGDTDKIAFNYGRELFVYPYRGVRRCQEAKVIDKRVYKGTSPTCHDFGPSGCLSSSHEDVIPLLVGFTGGQVHLIDPVHKELSKLFNEERMIDKTKVTCIKWAPRRGDMFLASHASGYLYTYLADTECHVLPPPYQVSRQGDGYTYYTCKSKPPRNPIAKCNINGSSINEFSFSPCGDYLATVSQDGFLRVFHFDTMELIGSARSYFGGLLCCAWSNDGRYIVVGGEDDLVTVYSLQERRVVVRGQGHRSWVSVVTFDVFNLSYGDVPDGLDFSGSDDEGGGGLTAPPTLNSPPTSHRGVATSTTCTNDMPGGNVASAGSGGTSTPVVRGARAHETGGMAGASGPAGTPSGHLLPDQPGQGSLNTSTSPDTEARGLGRSRNSSYRDSAVDEPIVTCYRFGSVGQDTMICLWDLTEDILKLSQVQMRSKCRSKDEDSSLTSKDSGLVPDNGTSSGASTTSSDKQISTNSLGYKLATLNFGSSTKESSGHKRAFSLPGRGEKKDGSGRSSKDGLAKGSRHDGAGASGGRGHNSGQSDMSDSIGSAGCPRLKDTPILEPIVMKKIAHERLTALLFREECIVTACQDGYICTWARPGHVGQHGHSSPGANTLERPGSAVGISTGTVV